VRRIIEQDRKRGAPGSSVDSIRRAVASALDGIAELLHQLPAAHGDGGRLLVPDTNALLVQARPCELVAARRSLDRRAGASGSAGTRRTQDAP
jgi:hypothetical protein